MANFEIAPATTGNGLNPAVAAQLRRSAKKFFRLGNKKVRLFAIAPGGTNINEQVTVRNGRNAQIFPLKATSSQLSGVSVSSASSGENTVYTITGNATGAVPDWSLTMFGLLVEVGNF